MMIEAFIIHLARAESRRPQVDRLLKQLPMPASVVAAVDGMALTEAEVAAVYRPALHRPRYPFQLRPAEIGCFLSHRKVWQMIVDRGLDAGLVVEDDVEIDAGRIGRILDLAKARMLRSDIVRLPKKPRGETGGVLAADDAGRLVLPRNPMLGMQAQLVGRDAAKKLLAVTQQFDRPVDTLLQMRWLHDVRLVSALPVVIREIASDLGGTTIQKKDKSMAERVTRELLRARYRLNVRLRNALTRPATLSAGTEN